MALGLGAHVTPEQRAVIVDALREVGAEQEAAAIESVLHLWLLEQDHVSGYDTYDSCVVVAPSEETARAMLPSGYAYDPEDPDYMGSSWCAPEHIKVTYLGPASADAPGVVCASFNAG